MSASEMADAVERAASRRDWTFDRAPVSDGGEGFVEAVGGANRTARVSGPLGGVVRAGWRLQGDEAYVEMALASGLVLAGGAERNDALAATTRGTGELIVAALDAGARRIVVGLGGSASTDGGLGCFEVLGSDSRIPGTDLVGACDVMLPFQAALEFAPQKGASLPETRLLTGRLERVAQIYESEVGLDVRPLPGAGAAGGLGGGLAALGATLVPGMEVVAESVRLDERLGRADLVVTGEGFLDAHSFQGKAVGWILDRAADLGVPALVVVGDVDPELSPFKAGRATVVSLVEQFGTDRARSNTLDCIEAVIDDHLRD